MRRFSGYEWLLSNLQGAYALGPANLLNHRKYHGLLVSSTGDLKRTHLVSSIEEKVEAGREISFFMDSNSYPNLVYPQGYKHLLRYFFRPHPVFLYSSIPSSYDILILKSIQLHPGLNFSVVRYKNMGKIPLSLRIRPKFTLRDHHTVNRPGYWDEHEHMSESRGDTGKVAANGHQVFLFSSNADILLDPLIYRDVTYPTEIVRGYEGVEDLLAPFEMKVDLKPGEEEILVFGDSEGDFARIALEAEERYDSYPSPAGHPLASEARPERLVSTQTAGPDKAFTYDEYLEILKLCVSEFIAGDNLVAGFPWFAAWGRDTMISMEAMRYLEGGVDLAYRMLKKYGENMREGLIPDTLGEGGVGCSYETVDAALWFGLRALEYWHDFNREQKENLLKFVFEVIGSYMLSQSHPFRLDPTDGLIDIHPRDGTALTWMDAKVYGEPVTPRYGKPIEVNALWYNVLRLFSKVAQEENIDQFTSGYGRVSVSKVRGLIRKVKKSLDSYFYETGFADRIENGRLEKELRPNYIIALSLPFDIVPKDKMKIGYDVARREMLTSHGLRTISPKNRAFRRKYMGNQIMRDLAYHQGTVWVWLLLPMAKLAAKIHGRNRLQLKKELEGFVQPFRDGFMFGEMASVPELYDGQSPCLPKGAPAQCWSVAAIFLIEKMIGRLGGVA